MILMIKREPVLLNQSDLIHVDVHYERCYKSVFKRFAFIKGKRYEVTDDYEVII